MLPGGATIRGAAAIKGNTVYHFVVLIISYKCN